MTGQDAFWLTLSVAVLAIVVALWGRKRLKLRRARSWPTAAGQVDSTTVRLERRGETQSVYVAEVKYSYPVQGATCSGSLSRIFVLKGSADRWIGGYPVGRALAIRYDGRAVNDSVLFEDEQA